MSETITIFESMKTYLFTGNQPIAFTLPDGKDVILEKGVESTLDPTNEYIAGLIGQGYLIEVETKKTSK
jgi:hypothetical protein